MSNTKTGEEMESAQEVQTHTHGNIFVISLNRPKARNAVNLAMAQGLERAISELDERPELRVGILTGAGPYFCAGMDLKAFANGERPWLPESGFGGLVERLPRKPLIAAVEGGALAGGLELALACDMIVASRTSAFGLPEVKRGLVAAAGGLLRLQYRIPRSLASELILTGRNMSGAEAAAAGLVTRLVDDGTALAGAMELAEEVASNAPLAVAASKAILQQARTWRDEEMFRLQEPTVKRVLESEDAQEGAVAFAQKRAPIWRGR